MTRIAAALPILILTSILVSGSTQAQPVKPGAVKVLRYVSQRTEKANMREGPTYAHRVLWEYRHKGYPFAVIAQFDTWRRVRAMDGTTGWMNHAMLSDRRTVLVTGKGRVPLYDTPDARKVVALADPGAVANLKACAPKFCEVTGVGGVDGWVPRTRIWGVGEHEVFDKLPRRH